MANIKKNSTLSNGSVTKNKCSHVNHEDEAAQGSLPALSSSSIRSKHNNLLNYFIYDHKLLSKAYVRKCKKFLETHCHVKGEEQRAGSIPPALKQK